MYASGREIVAALRAADPDEQLRIVSELSDEMVSDTVSALDWLEYDWRAWARDDQLMPPSGTRWRFMFKCAGRGGGKTRAGAESVREAAENPDTCAGRIALIAPTYGDIRITMVEGESGILAVCPPWNQPKWEPGFGKGGRLTWQGVPPPAGHRTGAGDRCEALCFTAEKPDSVRGPQFGMVWGDEIGAWTRGLEVHDLLDPAMRLGPMPRCVYTSTPRPTPLVEMLYDASEKELAEIEAGKRDPRDRRYMHHIWSTADNRENLPEETIAALYDRYGGTTQGRQELDAQLIRVDPTALWSLDMIDRHKVAPRDVPEFMSSAVAVDNATTVSKPGVIDSSTVAGRNKDVGSNDTGIVGVAKGVDGHYYVLDDWTMNAGPSAWGEQVIRSFVEIWPERMASTVVVEKQAGGDLIKRNLDVVLRDLDISPDRVPIRYVNATDGKEARADPIVALYEQGRVHHVARPASAPGAIAPLADLEYQMTRFKRGRTGYKKDRVDALVWGLTYLIGKPVASRSKSYGRRLAALT